MAAIYDDYVNVVDFGARPNSFADDTEAFLEAVNTGCSVYVPAGIFFVSQTLVIENQNFIGSGSFQTQIISTNADKYSPIIMAGRSCRISELLIMYKNGMITGKETEGERVGILLCSNNWCLQRGSAITHIRMENVGTCFYLSREYSGGGPFSVEHANLELQHFSFRAIDYGAKHSLGNVFSNIFFHSKYDSVDSIINLDGDSNNITMLQLVMIQTSCKRAAISINNVSGFNITTMHLGGIRILEPNHGFIELKNSSGEIGALHINYCPVEVENISMIRLYEANYDLCITEKEIVPSEHYLKIGNISVCGLNDPVRSQARPGLAYLGLSDKECESFKFISRPENMPGKYRFELGNYNYYTFKDDEESYLRFACDDDRIDFIKKGNLPLGGSTSERPKYRLCKYVTEYFDTDLGKKVCWDGEKWV